MKTTDPKARAARRQAHVRELSAQEKKDIRRREADQRQAEYSVLTPREALAKLDRLGHRAVKERAKLQKRINKEKFDAEVKAGGKK